METNSDENKNKDYELLGEDYPNYDFSFKIIVIGNSGKIILRLIIIKI